MHRITMHCMKDKQLVVRLSASQLNRLEAFRVRTCADSLSAAARAAIELGMNGSVGAQWTPTEQIEKALQEWQPVELIVRGE